ncbi:MAG: hypothetical protein GXO35_07580 [Gammaproteobacteria bacterium]|nr:hypothetical protein [Gammaproteobacteria bacterium]
MAELLRKQQQVLVIKEEVSYGIDANPTGANVILAQDMSVKMLEADTATRNNINGRMGAQGSITTSRRTTSSFGVEFAGSGDPDFAPAWAALLKICGFAQVIDAVNHTVSYTPIDAGFTSATLYYRIGKLQQILAGTRGKLVFNLDKGSIPSVKFDLISLYKKPTIELTDMTGVDDSAYKLPVGVTSESVTSCKFLGVEVAMSKLTVDVGIGVKHLDDVDAEEVAIESRNGSVSISFRTQEQSLVDAIDNASTNALGDFIYQQGLVAGQKLKIDVPQIQVKTSDVNWDGEFAYCNVVADIVPNARNNDLILTQL